MSDEELVGALGALLSAEGPVRFLQAVAESAVERAEQVSKWDKRLAGAWRRLARACSSGVTYERVAVRRTSRPI